MKKQVVIIDYDLGNLFSVKQACDFIGLNSIISSDTIKIKNADALILPGVGSFNQGIKNLKEKNIFEIILKSYNNHVPIFGICLGMQMLFTSSDEFELTKGLNLIKGKIIKFKKSHDMKIPHMGWNNLHINKNIYQNSPLKNFNKSDYLYFVHSFYVKPDQDSIILSSTTYNDTYFCSSILKNNIFATQFHPEKSGLKGLSIYRNWAKINKLI
tara:strand:+ start:714 stop:1352 length:639 start_codon:yes stop_codon:yes gene_type:complete